MFEWWCAACRLVLEDAEYTIFTVTLFKRVEDEFRHKCREHHFTVREFKFDDEAVAKERADLQSLQAEQKRLYVRPAPASLLRPSLSLTHRTLTHSPRALYTLMFSGGYPLISLTHWSLTSFTATRWRPLYFRWFSLLLTNVWDGVRVASLQNLRAHVSLPLGRTTRNSGFCTSLEPSNRGLCCGAHAVQLFFNIIHYIHKCVFKMR